MKEGRDGDVDVDDGDVIDEAWRNHDYTLFTNQNDTPL
jgi:hypothetical protein